MTTYPFDMQLVVDPFNTFNVVANGQVYIYDPADTGNTAPLVLTDPNGLPLINPLFSNSHGFIPPFVASVPQVKWAGGGFVGYFSSFAGLRDEAISAKGAAEVAATAANAAAASAALASSDAAASSGISILPDPGNPGLYFITSSGQLVEDPINPGFYLVGA